MAAMSSTSPTRPRGRWSNESGGRSSGFSPPPHAMGESIVPGTTALTRIPLGPSSAAAVLVSPRMAHFEAP